MKMDDTIRFPIGPFQATASPSQEERNQIINQIPEITKTLRQRISRLQPGQLQIPYRPNGWNIRQIVHHMADNDMNAYIRFKRALTEESPVASSYRQDLWAELTDYKEVPVENSLLLLEALHQRFFILLRGLGAEDFNRELSTSVLGTITLDIALQRFLWHDRHHTAQIEALINSRGW